MKTHLLSLLLALTPLFTADRACGGSEDSFTAHEWGTFTSVQAADGILIPWNPYLRSELPGFVYDRTQPRGDDSLRLSSGFDKYNLSSLQRMETPVIYFYSAQERTVNVTVKFPQGLVTEWYPRAQKFGPATSTSVSVTPRADSFIQWSNLKILPWGNLTTASITLPQDQSGSHYFTARATDAGLVQTTPNAALLQKVEQEKFLFYRGLGQFQSPVRVSVDGADQIVLDNASDAIIPHLFVFQLHRGQGSFQHLENVKTGKMPVPSMHPERRTTAKSELADEVSLAMEQALVSEGLFPREAAAMVATWRDSWFAEEGTRVFYTVPHAFTDRTLPLTIEPKPGHVARVFVARAEIIMPAVERQLREQITRFGDFNPLVRQEALAAGRDLKLGRFAAVTVSRVVGKDAPREFADQAWKFYNAMVALGGAPKTASVR